MPKQKKPTDKEKLLKAVPTPPLRFEVYKDQAGEWRFRPVSHNGQIIGGEGYTNQGDCIHACDLFRKFAAVAPIVVLGPTEVTK